MSINWSELITDLAHRRTILVIGSGISHHSQSRRDGARPPLWKEFLEKTIRKYPSLENINLIQDALKKGDYLHACEWLKRKIDSQWNEHLRSEFIHPQYSPAKIHEEIFKIDSRIVFTLNFDKIYENYANHIGDNTYLVKEYHHADVTEFLRGYDMYIIKVHGSIDNISETIFTQEDYSQARIKHANFYQVFNAALLNYTFVFLGCGINDPDINLLLENQNFQYQKQRPHFFIAPENEINSEYKKSLRRNKNLKVLEYDPIDNEHSGLVEELKELNILLEDERNTLRNETG